MKNKDNRAWMFVVDTDQSAGNFEREMGSYLTGRVWKYFSDNAVALAKLYRRETGDLNARQFAMILGRHESDGEHRPNYTDTWETPGWFSNGVGGHFRDGQEAEALEHHRKYYLKEAKSVSHLHPDDRERTRQDYLTWAKEPLHKWPSGMSVAIALTERPSPEQLAFLKERVKSFPSACKSLGIYLSGPIPKITGSRLLRRENDRYIEET